MFHPHELQYVLRQLNARLRHALATKPRREGGSGDGAMVAMSSAGIAFMAGRGAMAGAGAGAAAVGIAGAGGLVIPVVGIAHRPRPPAPT